MAAPITKNNIVKSNFDRVVYSGSQAKFNRSDNWFWILALIV